MMNCAWLAALAFLVEAKTKPQKFLRGQSHDADVEAESLVKAKTNKPQKFLQLQFNDADVEAYVRKLDRDIDLEEALAPMYASLPKNADGKLEPTTVRYALDRYFMHQHGWSFHGLRSDAESLVGLEDEGARPILTMQGLIEKHEANGVDLTHLAELASGLKHMVRVEVIVRMRRLYAMHELEYMSDIPRDKAYSVMETFYISILFSWKVHSQGLNQTMFRKALFYNKYPNQGPAIQWFNETVGKIEDLESFSSMIARGQNLIEKLKGFTQSDCRDISQKMSSIPNGASNGRLRLSAFYLEGTSSHFSFREKEQYLRDQGVLDETDFAHPAVIIPNYVMSKSNCFSQVSTIFDMCCAMEECEDLTKQVEAAFGNALATPSSVSKVFRALSTRSTPARDMVPALLSERLEEIAVINDGSVPLHGRLFQQWMHHAFPLECPFPHVQGTVVPMTHDDWGWSKGTQAEATDADISKYIEQDTCSVDSNGNVGCGMSAPVKIPWSRHEEVLSLHVSSRGTDGSKGSRSTTLLFCVGGLLLALLPKHFNKLVKHYMGFNKRAAKLEKI